MKHKLKFVFFLIFILTAGNFVVPGISTASDPLPVGILHWEKFPSAEMMKNSYQMALEDINKAGGVKGRSLKLVYGDDQGGRKPGEKAVRELIKKGVVMLIGGYTSSNTIYTARMADKLDIPFLVCTAADDRITHRKWKNVFRLNPSASEYTKGLEDFFLKEIKPKTVAIVYENSPYGTGSAIRMMWFCREHDIEIQKIIPYHRERAGSAYFQRIIAPLKEAPPDVIYMVSYLKDGVALVKKIRELNIRSLLCGGAGGFTHQKFITMAGKAADKLLTVSLWHHQSKYPEAKAYYNQYAETYSATPDYHGAEAYSALLVAADALKRAKSYDLADIRAALNQTDMKTPFGPVKFRNYGKFERQNSSPTLVLQIIQNTFESIWPENLATSKFVSPPDWRRSD